MKSVVGLLRSAQLARGGYYRDNEYPKMILDEKKQKYVVSERSPCEDDLGAMAAHRGWAWIAVGYNVFARTIESRGLDGPKIPEGKRSNQSIDLDITRHGRTGLLRVLQVGSIAHALETFVEESKLPLGTRADVVAFLKTLLAFKGYYDLLSQSDTDGQLTRSSRDLITRINALLPSGAAGVNTCLAGYMEHVVTLQDGRQFDSGSIYSGGIAAYSVGFWWRREGEGTSALAKAGLEYAITRLDR